MGHQGIYLLNGGKISRANEPMHGRLSKVYHNKKGLFKGIEDGFKVTRYHSLVCENKELENIRIDALSEDGVVMAISHKYKPIYGLQFHPESIASEFGEKLIQNFLSICNEHYKKDSLEYRIIDSSFDTATLYQKLKKIDDKILWLDSSRLEDNQSNFSIFGIVGEKRGHILKYDVDKREVTKIYKDKRDKETFHTDIFTYLKENRIRWENKKELPFDFQLGYIGYFAYELKKDTENVINTKSFPYPDAYLSYVDRAIVYDHKNKKLYILYYKDDLEFFVLVKDALNSRVDEKKPKEKRNFPKLNFVKNRKEYIDDIEIIKEEIRKGETYEVCLTNRLDIHDSIDGLSYYLELRDKSPGQYSAYLPLDEFKIASSSMERFIKLDRNNIVSTKPIKGTIRRGISPEEDKKLIEKLRTDEKTRSENLMIVDLLRNDLGKFCVVGSVKVEKLMDVESYKTLHQLVTTISGKLMTEMDSIDVLEKTFPGGSMTGSPKEDFRDY